MKTADLTGKALDWAVTKILMDADLAAGIPVKQWVQNGILTGCYHNGYGTDWVWGGPIIQREGIDIRRYEWQGPSMKVLSWSAQFYGTEKPCEQYGPTPLIAAMRCYVASKLGNDVDIPKELL